MTAYWLVKSEPEVYSYDDLVRDGKTMWDGVRNYGARNNLRAMSKGDQVLYYHSGDDKAVVGIAEVVSDEAYADPTAAEDEGDWVVVDVAPVRKLARPVTLAQIKKTPALANMKLVKQGRLSVVPVTAAEHRRILKLAQK